MGLARFHPSILPPDITMVLGSRRLVVRNHHQIGNAPDAGPIFGQPLHPLCLPSVSPPPGQWMMPYELAACASGERGLFQTLSIKNKSRRNINCCINSAKDSRKGAGHAQIIMSISRQKPRKMCREFFFLLHSHLKVPRIYCIAGSCRCLKTEAHSSPRSSS